MITKIRGKIIAKKRGFDYCREAEREEALKSDGAERFHSHVQEITS